MGAVTTYVMAGLMILGLFFVGLLMFNTAVNVGGYANSNPQNFTTFGKVNQYASNLENQTKNMQTALQSQGSQSNNNLNAADLLNVILQSGSLAVLGLVSIISVGIVIMNDIGVVLGPAGAFFVMLAVIGFSFKFIAQLIEAVRGGRL